MDSEKAARIERAKRLHQMIDSGLEHVRSTSIDIKTPKTHNVSPSRSLRDQIHDRMREIDLKHKEID